MKLRFAPSPTGNLHIGNIRIAIFNWIFAKKYDGKFYLRIEDTDQSRDSDNFIKDILNCMKWLDIDFNDDIYYQSNNIHKHLSIVNKLICNKLAYYNLLEDKNLPIFFRIPFNLDNFTNVNIIGNIELKIAKDYPIIINYSGIQFTEIKNNKTINRKSCLSGMKDLLILDDKNNIIFNINDVNFYDILDNKISYRFTNCYKIIFTRREIFFEDLIAGRMSKFLDNIEDFIIIRSNNTPVFHISNVCDDIDQKITHVIRGNDHLDNTFKHILLFFALNCDILKYGHLSMIVNKNNKPYSKRDGDTYVMDFKNKGFLPEVLFNYLLSLGWNFDINDDVFLRDKIINYFSFENIGCSPVKFDIIKLLHINHLHITNMNLDLFCVKAYEFAINQNWGNFVEKKYFYKIASFLQSRTNIFSDVISWRYFFFDCCIFNENYSTLSNEALKNKCYFEYKTNILIKILNSYNKLNLIDMLNFFISRFEFKDEFLLENIRIIFDEAEELYNKLFKNIKLILRIVLTGINQGADLFNTLIYLGKIRVINRLRNFILFLNNNFDSKLE